MANSDEITPGAAADSVARSEAAERRAARSGWLTQASSVLALAISFLALAVGAYQTRLMQGQARASVWPHLHIGFSHRGDPANPLFVWQVDNNGVGPALIQTVRVSLDGKPMQHWKPLFDALGADLDAALVTEVTSQVLPPSLNRETVIQAVSVSDRRSAEAFYAARQRLDMRVCYCSVYRDECWEARWLVSELVATPRCEARPDDFQE